MTYETVIGIEIHCELKTRSKMFSGAPVTYGAAPNTAVNEIDLGHPGVLPSLNKAAVQKALQACMALNLSIDPLVRFDRKNYFYADLPKGFQITQQFYPIGKEGWLDIEVDGETRRIRINRLHMEEDTAKQYHVEDASWIDFNRAGVPLVEIVSEADLRTAKEAMAYVDKLRNILVYLDVTDGKMEEGSLRCDINISLRPVGTTAFGTKTEIKNINSISNIEKAVASEIARQSALLDAGQPVEQATRRYDDVAKTTVLMRMKEGSVDYKYFPEPNIPPVLLSQTWIDAIRLALPELPDARYARYRSLGLSDYDAGQLIQNKALSDLFDALLPQVKSVKLAANWCLGDLLANLSQDQLTQKSYALNLSELAAMINALADQTISSKQAKDIFGHLLEGQGYDATVKALDIVQVSDTSVLSALVDEVLNENPQSIVDYHAGKDRALGFLVGQLMKKSKGQANPALSSELLKAQLATRKPQ
jgi:aspartyl-tRNA(Asn)/glutamyl-tRNA(Gln) amidotransferase subunit B